MPLALQIGCGLIAFGPSLVLLTMVVSKRSQLVIISISSAFMWLLALMFSSLVWTAIPPLKDLWGIHIFVAVLCQEVMRYAMIHGYTKIERGIDALTSHEHVNVLPLNDTSSSIAAGLGFGTMSGVMLYGSVLGTSGEDATAFVDSCSMPLVMLSAFNTLAFILLHIVLMPIAFDAWRCRNTVRTLFPFLMHITASYFTMLNDSSAGCTASVPLVYAVLIGASALLIRDARKRYVYHHAPSSS